jgi:hypothetical protein
VKWNSLGIGSPMGITIPSVREYDKDSIFIIYSIPPSIPNKSYSFFFSMK